MNIHKEIDTRGLNCPLPILKAKKALADMASGQLLKVQIVPESVRELELAPGREVVAAIKASSFRRIL